MRTLGPTHRTSTPATKRALTAPLLALSVLLAACGEDDTSSSDQDSPSPSATSTSPSEDPTPSVLEGGTRVEGPGFSFIVHPDYQKSDNSGTSLSVGSWYRLYSVPADAGLTSMSVKYEEFSQDLSAKTVPQFLRIGGATKVRRDENLQLMERSVYHWVATGDNVVFNTYLVPMGPDYSVQVSFERSPRHKDQERIQQAMMESFRVTK